MTAALTTLLERVEAGDCLTLTVDGVTRYYRARKSAARIGHLKLCDLQPDPVSDANAMMARALIADTEGR